MQKVLTLNQMVYRILTSMLERINCAQQGCTNPECQVTVVTKYFTLAPTIGGFSV